MPVRISAKRFSGQIDVDRSGQGIGDDQRWRGQECRANLLVNPALEVTISGEHRGDDQFVRVNCLCYLANERPGVADTRCAAIAYGVEAECFEKSGQAG